MPTIVNGNNLCPILLTSERTPPWGLPLAEAGTEEAAWHLWDVIEDGYEPPRSDIDGYQPAADLLSWFIYLRLDEAENRWRRWVYFREAADKTAAHARDSRVCSHAVILGLWISQLLLTVDRTAGAGHICDVCAAGRCDNHLLYSIGNKDIIRRWKSACSHSTIHQSTVEIRCDSWGHQISLVVVYIALLIVICSGEKKSKIYFV